MIESCLGVSRQLFRIIVMVLAGVSGAMAAETYTLGPDDQLRVRAVAWNEAEQRFDNWDVVSGEYTIQSDGTLAIPLGGAIMAADLTTEDLAEAIAETLRTRSGMIEAPAIAIEIVTYRPFYIIGDIARPGAYPARPGLTVLQAMALAGGGGERRAEGPNGLDGMREASALRDVLNQIARAQARQARLEAEVAKKETIVFPATIHHPDGPETLDRIFDEEHAIFEAREAANRLARATLHDLQALLSVEIEGLQKKLDGQAEQVRLARENFETFSRLAETGAIAAIRLSDTQRSLIDLEGKETDLLNNIYRARQSLAETDRDIIELDARRETQATVELQNVRAELEQLGTRRTLLEQIVLANGLDSQVIDLPELVTTYSIVRSGETEALVIGSSAQIRPGDVLTVTTELVTAEDTTR